jgi:PAS domain S-box-containing protein
VTNRMVQQENDLLRADLAQLRQDYERLMLHCEHLQKSEARYRQIFENAPISMLSINTDGYITQMNAAAEDLFGLPINQLNQQGCPIFDNPQLVENGTLPYMLQAFAGEAIVEVPTYYDAASEGGVKFFSQGHYAPIRDEFGVVQEIVEIAPDVSALFAAQQAIQDERERAAQERAQLLSTIAEVTNLLLKAEDYTSVLPQVVKLLGEATGSDRCMIGQRLTHPISGESALRTAPEWCKSAVRPSEEFSPHLDQLFLREHDAPCVAAQLTQGEVVNCLVTDLSEPDRSLFAMQGNSAELFVPILVNRECWGFICFDRCGEPRLSDEAEIAILKVAADSLAAAIERQAKDNDLRESERRYRTLFELSSEGIVRFGYYQPIPIALSIDEQLELCYQSTYIAEANNAFVQMYEHLSSEETIRLTLRDFHDRDSEVTQTTMREWIKHRYSCRQLETVEVDRRGRKRYFLNSSVSTIEQGCVNSSWVSQVDVTDLRETQQAWLEAEQARSQLLQTTATLANQLLRAADYTTTLPDVLRLLGEAAIADRCYLIENLIDPQTQKPAARIHTEWCQAGIAATIKGTPELASGALWDDFPGVQERLVQGEMLTLWTEELPEPTQREFRHQGIVALKLVPILVQGEFWGVFGFDYCGAVHRLSPEEKSIFAIAVDSISAAIER